MILFVNPILHLWTFKIAQNMLFFKKVIFFKYSYLKVLLYLKKFELFKDNSNIFFNE